MRRRNPYPPGTFAAEQREVEEWGRELWRAWVAVNERWIMWLLRKLSHIGRER